MGTITPWTISNLHSLWSRTIKMLTRSWSGHWQNEAQVNRVCLQQLVTRKSTIHSCASGRCYCLFSVIVALLLPSLLFSLIRDCICHTAKRPVMYFVIFSLAPPEILIVQCDIVVMRKKNTSKLICQFDE